MTLDELAGLDRFALLGPGYGDGDGRHFLLLEGLREAASPSRSDEPAAATRLVYAPFEAPGERAHVLVAAGARAVDLELGPPHDGPGLEVTLRAPGHALAVERIRSAIAAGDVYQVCLTVRADVRAASGAAILAAVCRRGVPRFAAWVRLPWGEELVSGSPELFFETHGERVHAEPMKGTARPGAAGLLEASDKDRAELAMITDLLRNDLTPVCRPRTVAVPCDRRLLELPYALQTVSDVVGALADGVGPLEVLAALHPGGSVTGAPKQAALAMIRALEEGPRGAYCGALGLWRGDRSIFGLLIRTATRAVGAAADAWVYGVGGGIVHASEPALELEELRVKLGALR